jgi:hypothetical protein
MEGIVNEYPGFGRHIECEVEKSCGFNRQGTRVRKMLILNEGHSFRRVELQRHIFPISDTSSRAKM